MAKYSEQFKRQAVDRYLNGPLGFDLVAREFGVDPVAVTLWVRLYQAHGDAGLANKRGNYTAKFKLSVLRHKWKHELSGFETAVVFNIRSPASIGTWERCYDSGGIDGLRPPASRRENRMPTTRPPTDKLPLENMTRDELVAEVNHLRMEVAYRKKLQALVQAEQTQKAVARKKRK
jgi:transposase